MAREQVAGMGVGKGGGLLDPDLELLGGALEVAGKLEGPSGEEVRVVERDRDAARGPASAERPSTSRIAAR